MILVHFKELPIWPKCKKKLQGDAHENCGYLLILKWGKKLELN
jgi:hypothetical protein